jgi:hypothetical protein
MGLMSKNAIIELTRKIDQQQDFCDGEKEGLKALYESVKGFEMRSDAFKSALKLRKMKPTAMTSWLHTFDAVRDALGLDAQLDLEDHIAEQMAKPESATNGSKAAAKPKRGKGASKPVVVGDRFDPHQHLGTAEHDDLPPAA